MKTISTLNELKKLIADPQELIEFILEKIGEDYGGVVGLRGLYRQEKIGSLRDSRVWEDGNETDEELDGTSTVMISGNWCYDSGKVIRDNISRYAENVFAYGNGRIGLVIGDSGEGGEDIGEIIIRNAECIYIWK